MAKCRGMVHTHVTKPEDIQNVPCKAKAVKIFSNRIQLCAGLKFQLKKKTFAQGKDFVCRLKDSFILDTFL